MVQFRVTKYDPAKRDEDGRYLGEEWTSYADVGREVNGSVVRLSEYERFEAAYVASALAFLDESGIEHLDALGVENARGSLGAPLERARLSRSELEGAIRDVLRGAFWCRFEGPDAFIHIGWDYYMYVGVPTPCPSARSFAEGLGLFVEPCPSPYRSPLEESDATA